MKKLLALLLVLSVMLTLVACGAKKEATETPQEETSAPAEETAEAAEEEPAEETAETAEEEPADNKFTQAISTYIAVDDSHSLCFHIYRRGGDESFYLAEDELVDFIQPYTAAFELVQKEDA